VYKKDVDLFSAFQTKLNIHALVSYGLSKAPMSTTLSYPQANFSIATNQLQCLGKCSIHNA